MACIIKIPSDTSKGIITFTTIERDNFILDNSQAIKNLNFLKKKWLIGIHHNWHDFNFRYNNIFDFHFAGKTDLIEENNKKFLTSDFDCCNFIPDYFKFNNKNKTWDLLFVGRPAYFKRLDKFYDLVRELYDKKVYIKVLCIVWKSKKKLLKDFYEFEDFYKVYLKRFTNKERNFFNLISLDNDKPFTLNKLSKYYKKSRVYIHTSEIERRSRTTAYALKGGMPVVGMDSIASIANNKYKKEPFIFIAKKDKDFLKLTLKAIKFSKSKLYQKKKMIPSMENFNYKKNEKILIKFFEKIEKKRYKKKDLRLFNLKKLDYRLGQSYIYKNQNWNIDSILKFMKFANNRELIQICKYEIPEKKMEKKRKFYTKQSKSVSPIRTASRLFQEFKVIIKWFYFGLLKHR
jgi:glycosyltransferase involved in cell wall biosynthesis